MQHEKFKEFLKNLFNKSENSNLLECVINGYNACFESQQYDKTYIVDSQEADQLSNILKMIEKDGDASKEELNKIYNLFIRMDKSKFNEPFDIIFGKIKGILANLKTSKSTTDDVTKYIKQFI